MTLTIAKVAEQIPVALQRHKSWGFSFGKIPQLFVRFMKTLGKFALALIGIVAVSASTARALPTLDIDVDPAAGIQSALLVQNGSTFRVDIIIDGVSGLFAYEIDVGHDPALLDATDVTEGPFLGTAGSTFFMGDDSSNPVNAVATLLSVSIGASGSGILYSIEYTALAPGEVSLTFAFVDLADDQLNTVEPSSADGARIVVRAAPSPSTLLLLLAGLAVMAALRRRRKVNAHGDC